MNATSMINEVPAASHLPFHWTVNAYRGCSCSCVYCLSSETPVLMADDSHEPIAELIVGDNTIGTRRVGNYRQFVETEVLATWRTVKPAFRVTLGASAPAAGPRHRRRPRRPSSSPCCESTSRSGR